MSTEILEMQIVKSETVPVDDKLVAYAGKTGLEKQSTETLVEAFRPIFAKSRVALDAAIGVAESVKDATCVTEIRKSRACRLAIRAVRLEADATRKKQKEHALLYGRAVDGFFNILMADIAPVETALQDAEDTAERAEAARKAALKAARESELGPLLETPILGDLSQLTEAQYAKALDDAKLLRQAKLDAAAKIEAEAKAKAEADRLERERINAENERLKQEAIAREAAATAEREAAEKKLADERKAAAELAKAAEKKFLEERAAAQAAAKAAADKAAKEQAEIKAKADAAAKQAAKERAEIEAKAKAERDAIEAKARAEAEKAAKEAARLNAELAAKAKAEREAQMKADADKAAAELAAKKAAAAPDKAKLLRFADELRSLPKPIVRQPTLLQMAQKIEDVALWIEEQAGAL